MLTNHTEERSMLTTGATNTHAAEAQRNINAWAAHPARKRYMRIFAEGYDQAASILDMYTHNDEANDYRAGATLMRNAF